MIRRYLHSSSTLKVDIRKWLLEPDLIHVNNLPFKSTVSLASRTFPCRDEMADEKAPMVMIHGLFGSKRNYSMVGTQISEKSRRRVVGLDMRNHGDSEQALPHDYLHMARDTEQYLERFNRPVVLAGHLMGAKVAMLVALKRPQLVERLIIIDNSPILQVLDDQFTEDLKAMCHVKLDPELPKLKHSEVIKEVDKLMLLYEKDPQVRLFLMSNLKRPGSKSRSTGLDFLVPVMNFLKHNVIAEMGNWPAADVCGLVFAKPCLVLRGLQSPFVRDISPFSDYFPNIKVTDFNCGHWLVSEKPASFVSEVVTFLEG